MITQIRKGLKGKGFKTAIWIFLIALAGGGVVVQFIFDSFQSSQWALKINGSIVTPEQFAQKTLREEEYIKLLKSKLGYQASMYLQLYGIPDNPALLAKNQLVREVLLDQQVRKFGLIMDPDYIAEKVNDPSFVNTYLIDIVPLGAFVPGQGINLSRLHTELKHFNMTESDFEHELERAVARYIFTAQLLAPASYVPEYFKDYQYQVMYGPRTFSFAIVDYKDILEKEKKEEISDEELSSFFEREVKNKRYWEPEKRSGVIWSFDSGYYDLTIPDNRIENYYEQHKRDFMDEPAKIQVRRLLLKTSSENADVKKRAEELHAQLVKNPLQFEDLAKRYSQDEESVTDGGLLPFFSRGERNDIPFERAAFLLNKDGQISSVVKTNQGYDIIQRVEKKSALYKPINVVKDEIRDLLIQKKFEQRFIGDIRSMIKQRKIDEQRWHVFIENKSPKMRNVIDIDQQHTDRNLVKALYGLKKGEFGVYLDGQVGVVVMLNEMKKEHAPSLKDIYDQVLKDRREFRASKMLEMTVKDLQYASEHTSLEDAARKQGLKVQTVVVDPTNEQKLQELEKQGFPLSEMLQLENKNSIIRVITDQSGFVFRLDELVSIDNSSIDSEKKEELRVRMLQESVSYLTEGYVASLHRDATIKTDGSLIQTAK